MEKIQDKQFLMFIYTFFHKQRINKKEKNSKHKYEVNRIWQKKPKNIEIVLSKVNDHGSIIVMVLFIHHKILILSE